MLASPDPASPGRPSLARLLRCPGCDAAVQLHEAEAVCGRGAHRFPIVGGVVVMLDDKTLERDPQYERQRQYFDSEFERYDRYELESWRQSYLQRLRAVGALDGGPVVDVGVGGSGYTIIEAARSGCEAVGCDLSLAGLVKARAYAAAEGVVDRTLWVCCSAERLPLAAASFTAGLAIAVIEHVPDDIAALRELARVLRPGGRAWVTVPHALRNISWIFRWPNRRHDRRLGHLRRYEAESLAETARGVGFDVDDVQFTGHPVKVLQLLMSRLLHGRVKERLWWRLERLDLARSRVRRGSMQLSLLLTRGN